ncbi:CPBP family intramembrane glutamic endopeptidase [Gaetbulibacter saemankumensis]|uniref:CPBP family intramembrane glutamic endopeptidase n=1 Tax=Gaetbulibacter saemankumensis TaxID=311208 RepID=UPI00040DD584|nr:CPBP family intramembrane glutamic endopeptidase [Gaetbulibacter saemankumensis]
MYINQAFKGLNDWWRYLIGLFIIIVAVIIGQMPFTIAVAVKALSAGDNITSLDQSTMMTLLEPNLNLFLMLLSFAVGLVALLFVVRYIHNQTFTQLTTTRKTIDWKRFWFIFLTWGTLSSALVIGDYYMSPENYVLNFDLVPFLILCVIAIIFVPLQTSFEEYLFRGYLMQGLGVITKTNWLPLIITSIVFGLLHIANPEVEKLGYVIMVYYIGTGLFLGIMTLMDGGLELSLGFHAANNLFTALLVTADWTAFQTHSILKDMSDPGEMPMSEVLIPVFVLFPILLLILSRIYGWKNWKEKLFGNVIEPNDNLNQISDTDET